MSGLPIPISISNRSPSKRHASLSSDFLALAFAYQLILLPVIQTFFDNVLPRSEPNHHRGTSASQIVRRTQQPHKAEKVVGESLPIEHITCNSVLGHAFSIIASELHAQSHCSRRSCSASDPVHQQTQHTGLNVFVRHALCNRLTQSINALIKESLIIT